MMKTLYHGSSLSNLQNIVKYGFDMEKFGTKWSNTYGNGIYLTPNKKYAKSYSDDSNYILKVKVLYKPFYLKRNYSPNYRKDRRKLNKIRQYAIDNNYTCLSTVDNKEIILFDHTNIINYTISYISYI